MNMSISISDFIWSLVIAALLGFILCFVLFGVEPTFAERREAVAAIKECEAELPRNLKCDYVITAQVMKESK